MSNYGPPPPPPQQPPPGQPPPSWPPYGGAPPPGQPPYGAGPYGGPPTGGPPPRPRNRALLFTLLGVVLLVLAATAVVVVLVVQGDDDKDDAHNRASNSTTGASQSSQTPTDDGSETTDAPTSPSANEVDAAAYVGLWVGSYTCNQGDTSLKLRISQGASGDLTAVFEFGPTAANPTVEEGSYRMDGKFVQGELELTAVDWIKQPSGYSAVDIIGQIDASSPDTFSGRVDGFGCTRFTVQKSGS